MIIRFHSRTCVFLLACHRHSWVPPTGGALRLVKSDRYAATTLFGSPNRSPLPCVTLSVIHITLRKRSSVRRIAMEGNCLSFML